MTASGWWRRHVPDPTAIRSALWWAARWCVGTAASRSGPRGSGGALTPAAVRHAGCSGVALEPIARLSAVSSHAGSSLMEAYSKTAAGSVVWHEITRRGGGGGASCAAPLQDPLPSISRRAAAVRETAVHLGGRVPPTAAGQVDPTSRRPARVRPTRQFCVGSCLAGADRPGRRNLTP